MASDRREQPPGSRRLVPDHRLRDTLVAVVTGAVILGGLLYAFFYFSQQASATGRVQGVIVAKHFVPEPETQVTFGRDGLNTRRIEGAYSFDVRLPQEDGKIYQVVVGKEDYETRREGEQFSFYRE